MSCRCRGSHPFAELSLSEEQFQVACTGMHYGRLARVRMGFRSRGESEREKFLQVACTGMHYDRAVRVCMRSIAASGQLLPRGAHPFAELSLGEVFPSHEHRHALR